MKTNQLQDFSPVWSIPEGSDVTRRTVSWWYAVHGLVQRIQRLEHIEDIRIARKYLGKETGSNSLVG